MKLRIGIIGLGEAWERVHAPALRALSDRFEVRAICAEVAMRAERAAQSVGACNVDSFRKLTTRNDIDAVLMLEQDWIGALPVMAACDAGKSIYTTAALHADTDQALEIRQRVESSGVAYMAEFPHRYAPATLRLKELIATRLGEPRLLFCHHRSTQTALDRKTGRLSPEASAQCELMGLVNWCCFVAGRKPASVQSVRHRAMESPNEFDYQMLSLDFAGESEDGSGPLAQISFGNYLPDRWQDAIGFRPPAGLNVCCENGVAYLDLPNRLTWFDDAGQHLESLDGDRPVGEQMLMQFHRAVTSLVQRTAGLDDAYQAFSVVSAAQRSCVEGRRIKL